MARTISFQEYLAGAREPEWQPKANHPQQQKGDLSYGQIKAQGAQKQQPKPDNKLSFDTVMSWFEKPTQEQKTYTGASKSIADKRDELVSQLKHEEALAGFISTVEQEEEHRRKIADLSSQISDIDVQLGNAPKAYVSSDRADAVMNSWGDKTAAAYLNAVGNVQENKARYNVSADDAAYNSFTPEQQAEYDRLIKQRQQLEDSRAYVSTVEQSDELERQWQEINRQIEALGVAPDMNKANTTYAKADEHTEKYTSEFARAKEGQSEAEQMLIDLTHMGLDVAADAAASFLTGGVGGRVNMLVRSYGAAAGEARANGDPANVAMGKGITAGLIELGSEMLGGGFGKVYGSSLVSKAVDKAVKSPIVKGIISSLGEGLEEGVASVLQFMANQLFGWGGSEEGGYFQRVLNDVNANKEEIIYEMALGAIIGVFGSGQNIQNGNAPLTQSDMEMPKSGNKAKSSQSASDGAGDIQTPPSTTETSTEQSDELNSQGSDDGETKHTRVTDEYGFAVRNEPSDAAATETAKQDAEVSSKATAEADKPKDSIDVVLEAAGVSGDTAKTEKSPLPPSDLRADVYNKAEKEYAGEAKKFWAAHPELNEIPAEHPLADKETWVKKRVNDRLYEKSVEIREKIFDVKDDKNIPIKERLVELQALAEEEHNLGLVEEKRDWHIVDGEIVDATANNANTKTGDQRPAAKTVDIPDISVSIRGLSMREEPPAGVGTKVTNQMRDMGQSEKKAPASKKSSLDNPLTETVLQKQAENDMLSDESISRLSVFTDKQLNKFYTKPAIKLSKKEYAKVSDARVTNYDMSSDENIPELDAFPIAEYGKEYGPDDTVYTYVIRNSGRDNFEVIGKYKLTNRSDIVKEARTKNGSGTQSELSNSQRVNTESTKNNRQAVDGDSGSFEQSNTASAVSGLDEQRAKRQLPERAYDSSGNSRDNVNDALSPKAQAEKDFGKVFKDIQDSADRVETLKMFTEDERFKKWAGGNTASQVNKAVGNLVQTIRDFSNGHADINKLTEAYKSASKDDALKPFVSNRILASLERTQSAYETALNSSAQVNVNRFRHAANTSMKLIARRFELADQAVKNQLAVAEEAKKSAPKAFKKGLVGKALSGYATLQISGPNVFRWIDGFNPNSKGIGYATANAAEDCAVVENIEKVNGNKFFANLTKGKELDSFLRGERMTGVKVGGVELNEQQALTVIGMYRTMLATDKDKLKGLEGIAIPDANGGEAKFIKFDKDEDGNSMITQFVADLESALGGSAKEYEKAYIKMLSYFSPKVREATEDIYGVATRMFEDGKYFPLRYAFEGENISDYVFSENIEESIFMDDDASTASPGITKSRTKESGEYLLIEPVAEVMNRYINQASDYIAYGGFAQRLELMNTGSVLAPGVSETLNDTFGKSFAKWMDDYVEDMQPGYRKKDGNNNELLELAEAGAEKLRKNLSQGALLFNVGTPLKQHAAYWTSMGVLKPTAVMKAFGATFVKPNGDAKGNSMYEGRRLGNIDPTLNELLHSKDTWLSRMREKSKVVGWAADAIGRADAKVVDRIFTATIYDVAMDNPGMDKNSAQFKKLVESKFEEVMVLTQSTSSRSIAPELQRTDNQLLRMMSMFRSQQMQELNRMVKAIGEAKAAKGTDAAKNANKTLRQSVAGQMASYLELGIMTAVVNALLHKHDQYEDEDDKFDAAEILKKISIDVVENAAGTLWLGDSAAQFLIEEFTGENEFYGIPLGPLNTIKSFVDSVGWLIEKPTLPNLKRVIGNAGNLKGIPVNNVYNFVNASIMWAMDIIGKNEGDYDDILKSVQAEITKRKKAKEDAIDMLINAGKESSSNIKTEFGISAVELDELNNSISAFKKDKTSEYDTSGDAAIARLILDAGLTDTGTDAMIVENTGKKYEETYDVLRDLGLAPKKAIETYADIDSDSNGNIKQTELKEAYLENPGMEYIISRIWASKGWKTSWESYRDK